MSGKSLSYFARPAPLTLLSALFAAFSAGVAWFLLHFQLFCSQDGLPNGANVDHALSLAFFGSLATLLGLLLAAFGFMRSSPRYVAVLGLFEAAVLSAAITFLALDSATYRAHYQCSFLGSGSSEEIHVDHLPGLYVAWGVPLVVLLVPVLRSWRTTHRLLPGGPLPEVSWPMGRVGTYLLFGGLVAVAVITAISLVGWADRSSISSVPETQQPPSTVVVCRNPYRAPEALGGPWICPDESDIGAAPIAPPHSLMCATDISGVKGKVVGIRLLYGKTLVKHADERSSDRIASAYATVARADIPGLAPGRALPGGRYRCLFLVSRKVVRVRTFAVRR